VLAAIAVLLAGCGGNGGNKDRSSTSYAQNQTASRDTALAQWGKAVLHPGINAMGRDFGRIGSAAQRKDLADVHAGCRQLYDDINSLRTRMLPSPDITVTVSLSWALDDFRLFSRSCQELTPNTSELELTALTGYRERGKSYLDKAVALVDAAQTGQG
jgi:hypothetical protein